MTRKTKDILISLVFIILGIFIFIQSMSMDPLMKNDVGSGFFPKVVAIVMIAMAILNLIVAFKEGNNLIEKKEQKNQDSFGGWATIVLIGIYVITYQSVGFLIGTSIYLFLQIMILSPKEKMNIPLFAIISVVTPVFIYFVFTRLINMPLPKGIFGF